MMKLTAPARGGVTAALGISRNARRLLVGSALAALAGCASFSDDGGFSTVAQLSRDRIGQAPLPQRTAEQSAIGRARVAELLAAPLSAEDAVQVALLNNRGLHAAYAELGIAEADLVRAGRLSNPRFTIGRLRGSGTEIDRAVLFDVLGLITMPIARKVEQRRFEAVQVRAASETVAVAAEARKAWFAAVAANELLRYFEQVNEAAALSSELARRMAAAGNFSGLARLREQAFHAEATMQLARAQHQVVVARERLNRMLGLSDGAMVLRLPERLPDLPAQPLAPVDAEQTALDKRLDVLLARRDAEVLAESLGLTRTTRFVNVLHAGYQNKSASSEALAEGYEIELTLPVFDFGTARVARAEALYTQALERVASVAVRARSEVRESYSAYRTAYALARQYRDEVVPLRRRISEEQVLRYNGMLASVFDLLADSKAQIASVVGAVESLRDQWIAETDLQTVMTGRSPGSLQSVVGARTVGAAQPVGH